MEGYDAVVASVELRRLRVVLRANRAEARLRLGRWAEALADCEAVLQEDPAHAKAAVRLSRACRGLGRHGEAVPFLQRAMQDRPAASHRNARARAASRRLAFGGAAEARSRALGGDQLRLSLSLSLSIPVPPRHRSLGLRPQARHHVHPLRGVAHRLCFLEAAPSAPWTRD